MSKKVKKTIDERRGKTNLAPPFDMIITYIYIRSSDNICVHFNSCGTLIGREYEHESLDWQPPADWPYKIKDMRIK